MADVEVVGGPEDSNFTAAELGVLGPGGAAKTQEVAPTTGPMGTTPDPDTVVAKAPATEEKKTEPEEHKPWHWNDDMPGQGDKPEYLLDKYKSVAEQAKALPEALKRFGSFKGAPEQYSFDGLPEGMDKDSPLLSGFLDTFKEMHLDQEGFNKIATKFAEMASGLEAKSTEHIIAEVGSRDIVDRVENWTKTFPPEVQETIKSWKLSGADIKALDAIRTGQTRSAAPTATEADSRYQYESAKSVEAEKNANFKRYMEDDAYRSEVSRRWEEALNRESVMKHGIR